MDIDQSTFERELRRTELASYWGYDLLRALEAIRDLTDPRELDPESSWVDVHTKAIEAIALVDGKPA